LGIEIDAHYVDTIIRRFDEAYGLKAVHAESKLDFERLKYKRSKEMKHGQEAEESKRPAQKVGRGNPPRHTQFPKGKSGNPAGRPKGSKNFSTIIMEAASDHVTATVDGKKRRFRRYRRRRCSSRPRPRAAIKRRWVSSSLV